MKKQMTEKCDPCERNFEQKVDELVKEGRTPTHMEREKKEREVKAAFGTHTATSRTTMEKKAPAKEHAMAGGAKMKK